MTGNHPLPALCVFDRCVTALMDDPAVTGDLLLVGLWLARATILGNPPPTVNDAEWRMEDIAAALFPVETKPAIFGLGRWMQGQSTEPDVWRVAGVLKSDIRRYDVWVDQPGPRWARTLCSGPMVRRAVCGKPAQTSAFFTDVTTGRRRMVGGCGKHSAWFHAEWCRNRAEVAGTEVPRPPANAGGALPRHIKTLDWPALWRGLDPNWTPPPEVDSWARPKLKVIVSPGLASTGRPDGLPPAPRPRFAVIEGRAGDGDSR